MRIKVIVIVSRKEHLLVIKNWNHFEESRKTYTISHRLIYAPYATCRWYRRGGRKGNDIELTKHKLSYAYLRIQI